MKRRSFNDPRHAHSLTFTCFRRQQLLTDDRTRAWLAQSIEQARGIYEKLVKQYPRDAHYRFGLAFVEQQLGMNAEALAGYRKVIELAPDFAEAYYNLATSADATEDEASAIANYRKFLACSEGRADFEVTRAQVRERLAILEGN